MTMSLATPGCVQKLQAASHVTSCVFSESRMREICLSGSMSGNRKQGQVKPDCGGRSESPTQQPPGDYSYCACSRLYCMVRRPNARRIGLDEKQSAKMYPASSGEWSPGA